MRDFRGLRNVPAQARFWDKVEFTNNCWEWLSNLNNQGYGVVEDGTLAHRTSYELVRGEKIPEGMVIDHLCKNTICVNPSHLEVVTPYENWRRSDNPFAKKLRQTHCIKGHPLSGENLIRLNYSYARGRRCRTCVNAAKLKYYHQRKGVKV